MLTASIIAALVSAAASGYGAYKSGQANKKNRQLLDSMGDENQSEYMKEYYRGSLENPGSKAYLKRLDETMKDNTKAVENNAAATGATQENVLAAKQNNNKVMSDAVGGLVENEDSRKQQVKQNYLQRKQSLIGGQMGMNSQVAQNWATTAGNVSNAAGSLASAYLMSDGKLFNTTTPNNVAIAPTQAYLNKFNSQITG